MDEKSALNVSLGQVLPEGKEHPLLVAHPNFAQAHREFQSFLKTAEDDLKNKTESLRNQRKSIIQRHRGVRHYLDCQIFMLSKHSRRLEQFMAEANFRLASICETFKEDEGSKVGTDLVQLLADMGKMKRRCKHIIDVTDRYCVLTAHDLEPVKQHTTRSPSTNSNGRSDLTLDSLGEENSMDEVDGIREEDLVSESPSVSRRASMGAQLPSQITQNIVKSTLESFGSHLAVIAKTYTRKRAGSVDTVSV